MIVKLNNQLKNNHSVSFFLSNDFILSIETDAQMLRRLQLGTVFVCRTKKMLRFINQIFRVKIR